MLSDLVLAVHAVLHSCNRSPKAGPAKASGTNQSRVLSPVSGKFKCEPSAQERLNQHTHSQSTAEAAPSFSARGVGRPVCKGGRGGAGYGGRGGMQLADKGEAASTGENSDHPQQAFDAV